MEMLPKAVVAPEVPLHFIAVLILQVEESRVWAIPATAKSILGGSALVRIFTLLLGDRAVGLLEVRGH